MLNFRSILIFSEKPKTLADFYKNVLEKDPDWADDEYFGFATGNGSLTIGPHDKVKGKSIHPERIMINFETDHVPDEFERIKKLDAKVIAKPYHPSGSESTWIATFADPDNNIFQLTSPWEEMDSESN